MIIFEIPNWILIFSVLGAGMLMWALSLVLCLVTISILSKCIREWREKER